MLKLTARATALAFCFTALTISAAPAQQGWGVNDTPQVLEGFGQYCAIWYGNTQPMLQLQVRSDRRLLILSAVEFTNVGGGENATLNFPTGFEAMLPITNGDGKGTIIAPLSPAATATLLENLATPGTFRVTISGLSVSYPVPALSSAINYLRACENQLPSP